MAMEYRGSSPSSSVVDDELAEWCFPTPQLPPPPPPLLRSISGSVSSDRFPFAFGTRAAAPAAPSPRRLRRKGTVSATPPAPASWAERDPVPAGLSAAHVDQRAHPPSWEMDLDAGAATDEELFDDMAVVLPERGHTLAVPAWAGSFGGARDVVAVADISPALGPARAPYTDHEEAGEAEEEEEESSSSSDSSDSSSDEDEDLDGSYRVRRGTRRATAAYRRFPAAATHAATPGERRWPLNSRGERPYPSMPGVDRLPRAEGDAEVRVGAYSARERRALVKQYLQRRKIRYSEAGQDAHIDKERSKLANKRPRGSDGRFLKRGPDGEYILH